MQQRFEIRGRTVGHGAPVYVIAEAGSNHNGDLTMALRLIDVAATAGADAVKFQTFEARRLYTRAAGTSDYLGSETPIYDIIQAMEMPPDWLPQLRDRAHERGISFLSTPFHEAAVELLEPYVDAWKIASYELTHAPLCRRVAAAGGPVLISTGAADLAETREAVAGLQAAGCRELVVLQCTAAYPTPPRSANVRALVTLRDALGVPTGLSDHTRDPIAAPVAATALGAVVIEKHFTLDNDLPGPDHAFAVEPAELERMVRAIRDVEDVLGTGRKAVDPVELELRSFARRSVFSTRPIRRGERFTSDNVDVLRAGKRGAGLPPSALGRVLAVRAMRDLPADTPLCETDLGSAE